MRGFICGFRNVDPYCLGKNMYTKITVGADESEEPTKP